MNENKGKKKIFTGHESAMNIQRQVRERKRKKLNCQMIWLIHNVQKKKEKGLDHTPDPAIVSFCFAT